MKSFFSLLLIVSLGKSLAFADVPQFRGPGGTGTSPEKNLPTHWSEKNNLRWKSPLPGRGLSNPVIAGGRVYVTACSGYQQKRLHVLCFDETTGAKLWERQLWATGTTLCHPKTNMAAPTPITDGDRVFALFATGDLVGLSKNGELLWYRSLVGDYPTIGNNVGMAASPILVKDLVIVQMENAGESFGVGIDKLTGINRWRVERPRVINWTTPTLAVNQDQSEVLFQAGSELAAYDPATGEKKWSLDDRRFATSASPIFGDGLIFSPGEKLTALKPGKNSPEVVWESKKLPSGFASPTYFQGRIFTLTNAGVLNFADAKTGTHQGSVRLEGPNSASPLIADGKIFVVNEEGTTTVLDTGETPKILATNPLNDKIMASPVAANGAIFLRSDGFLYCLANDPK